MHKCLSSLEITCNGLAGGDKPLHLGGGEWRSQLPPRDQISRKLVALATQRALFITHAFLTGFIADEEPAEEALDLTKTDYSRPARMEEIAGESWRLWGADFDSFREINPLTPAAPVVTGNLPLLGRRQGKADHRAGVNVRRPILLCSLLTG